MKSIRSFFCFLGFSCAAFSQTAPAAAPPDRAGAYYYYSLGHLYADLASNYGNRREDFNKAIDALRQALKADPSASFISEELSDLYIQSGRLREAVTEAEEALKQNPSDLNSRRILARIYTRMIGDSQSNHVDENMVRKAIVQFQAIVQADPKDAESWLMLGRLQKLSQHSPEAEKAYKKVLEIDPNNEDALTGLALVYADLGNQAGAADLLRRAAEKNPSQRSLTALASTYEQMHDYALAAETLRRALDLSPGNAELRAALAQDLMLSEQYGPALKLYEAMVAENPKDVQSQLRISQIYRQQRDFAKARQAGEKARQMEPGNLEVRYNDVNLLEAEGKAAEAIAALKDIVGATAKKTYTPSETNNRVVLLERLGILYRQNEQYAEAVDTFRQIAELEPEMGARAAAQIIDTWRIGKNLPKAEAEAEAAAKKYPDDRVVRSVRASLLGDLGKFDEAIAETRRLMDGKNDREIWLSLSQLYEKAKKYDEMAKALDAAGKLSTSKEDKETVYFMRGAMYEKLKDYTGAEREFRKVLEINPANSSALNYLGYMLADRNVRLQEAQDLIRKALEREPNNGAYLDSLGWVLFRMNRLPEAEDALRRSVERMSKDPTVHDHLGDVYFHQGKTREAIAQWQRSLKEWDASSPAEMDRAEIAKVQRKLDNAKIRLARENGEHAPKP